MDIQMRMDYYRARLLAAGMLEPTRLRSSHLHWRFYLPDTELTAFVVNLLGTPEHLTITYGFASTAFTRMAGDENALVEYGIDDTGIALREQILIRRESDACKAAQAIESMYHTYHGTTKEVLLSLAKEKRTRFLSRITAELKPLGFRKKAHTWTRLLSQDYILSFNAQKSAFSDEYYFNLTLAKNGDTTFGSCFHTRLSPISASPFDWQALSAEEFDVFLTHTLLPFLSRFLNSDLESLGADSLIWHNCSCNRKKCPGCWVQKNLWEAQ